MTSQEENRLTVFLPFSAIVTIVQHLLGYLMDEPKKMTTPFDLWVSLRPLG